MDSSRDGFELLFHALPQGRNEWPVARPPSERGQVFGLFYYMPLHRRRIN
jgi:hypothetical protein